MIGASLKRTNALLPGFAFTLAITGIAEAAQWIEIRAFGRAWIEALVLAILFGTLVRSLWTPPRAWLAGINFSAKTLLEIAVMLLGASISAQTLSKIGLDLIGGIAAIVFISLSASYGIGRLLGLSQRLALLVACGNSICGNSAIAAVAPVIAAAPADVAASIAFTAVLGVIVVLGLPLLMPLFGLSETQYGVLAGLTVYAVPQVLAATMPMGPTALQIGTLVKLVRVLMLGPVVLIVSLFSSRVPAWAGDGAQASTSEKRLSKPGLVPWFIVGFIVLACLRTGGLIPEFVLNPAARSATWLTTISMAALGLGVDVRTVAQAGTRVTAAVACSLLLLGTIAGLVIFTFPLG